MKIIFHANQLSIRGTEVALYDYAHFNEVFFGNESIIIAPKNAFFNDKQTIFKFSKRFKNIIFYDNFSDLRPNADLAYFIKSGANDNIYFKNLKSCIHAVFPYDYEPHGNVYATISEWMSLNFKKDIVVPFVPHMINLPINKKDLRDYLNISKKAIVFGRYGGYDTFDIQFVKDVIKKVLDIRKDIFFIFMCTKQFLKHENVIFLQSSTDVERKIEFINTCDAMLHARNLGETFGLACGEFSICNKPVITYSLSQQKAHIDILKEKGIYYKNETELFEIINNFEKSSNKNWNAYVDYLPDKVMEKFKNVFLL
jgi:hypothetical protein